MSKDNIIVFEDIKDVDSIGKLFIVDQIDTLKYIRAMGPVVIPRLINKILVI